VDEFAFWMSRIAVSKSLRLIAKYETLGESRSIGRGLMSPRSGLHFRANWSGGNRTESLEAPDDEWIVWKCRSLAPIIFT